MKRKIYSIFTGLLLPTSILFGNEGLLQPTSGVMTHPVTSDGFGSQFQAIVYAAIYAELNNMKYVYTPFRNMEHNYNNDPLFIQKKEELINFIGHFEINGNPYAEPPKHGPIYLFIESNLAACANSSTLKKIKGVFRANKNRKEYFDNENFNIAVHVRRVNHHDHRPQPIPNAVYLDIISDLRRIYASKNPLFHIYSQGDAEAFKTIFGSQDVVLHINGSVEETFSSMVLADALVTSSSSLSYIAGYLSDGAIYYIPFWHPPLPGWTVINKYNYQPEEYISSVKR